MRRPTPLPRIEPETPFAPALDDDGAGQDSDAGHTDAGHTDAGHTDAGHTDAGHTDADHAGGDVTGAGADSVVEDDVAAAVRAAWEGVPTAVPAREAARPTDDVALPMREAAPLIDDAAPVIDDAAPPVRTRDVWRAARARRRALRGEVRRFTVRSRRRRTAWIVAAAAVVVLVVGTLGVAYSPLFAVERISVVGTQAIPAETLEEALSGQLGTPLPLVDESAVKQVLVGFPLVESYTLQARPPHDLVVTIVERTPIGVVRSPAGWSLVDAAGVVLETTGTAPAGRALIVAEGDIGSPAFEAIALVMRAVPDSIRAQVTQVTASTRDDVVLDLNGTLVVWGSVDQTPHKALVLETTMARFPADTVGVYDVSSPDAVVIR